jgi:Rrf2 family protein
VHVSAKGDYAVRAIIGLSAVHPERVSASTLADRYSMPRKFLEVVLSDLRRAGVVASTRGPEGGSALRREPVEITVGEVLRVIDGPLADIHGLRPDEVSYGAGLEHLQELWVAARSAVRSVLDEVTFDQLVSGDFPDAVAAHFAGHDAWEPRRGPRRPTSPRGPSPEFLI